jgi:hypothetical protein
MLRASIAAHRAKELSHWTLQYASGLAADEGWQRAWSALLPRAGQHLALLGNCCSVATTRRAAQTDEFLRRCSATWDTVSIVPGPRELSSEKDVPYYEQLDALRNAALESSDGRANVRVFDQGELPFRDQDIVVLGAGGWTAFHPHTMQAMPHEPIWYTPSQRLRPEHLAEWHTDDWDWMKGRHDWWAMHNPSVRRILLTYSLSTDSLVSTREREAAIRPMTIPYASNRWIFDSPHTPKPYAWLCGAGKGTVSGMVQGRFFIGVNAADASNPNYCPAKLLSVTI